VIVRLQMLRKNWPGAIQVYEIHPRDLGSAL